MLTFIATWKRVKYEMRVCVFFVCVRVEREQLKGKLRTPQGVCKAFVTSEL